MSGSTTSATSPKLALRLPIGLTGTTPSGPTRRSAIAARVSSMGYNGNSCLIPREHVWTSPVRKAAAEGHDFRLRACIRPLDQTLSASGHDGNPGVSFYGTTAASRALLPSQV